MVSSKFKTRILNYQRVRKAQMEFIPGLNVIVGESNQGKTAAGMRALETAIYNLPREDHITLGEVKSAVGIQYNGHEIIWRRDKESASKVSYRVDGKIYQKLGRGQPQEVAEALGISELEINDKKFRLNFSKQMSYPFLLDSTPSDMFKFIAQSSGEDNLIDVLKQMKKDVNEISVKVKSHEESQKVLGESLIQLEKNYNEIKDKRAYCEKILDLEPKVKDLMEVQEQLETYRRCKSAEQSITNSLNYNKKVYNDIASSVSVAESHISKLEEIDSTQSGYLDSKVSLMQLEANLERYNKLISDVGDIDLYLSKLRVKEDNENNLVNLARSLEEFNSLRDTEKQSEDSVDDLKKNVERYDKFIDAIGKVLDIREGKLQDINQITEEVNNYRSLMISSQTYKKEVATLTKELEVIQSEIEKIGVCPYCGSALIGGSHGH